MKCPACGAANLIHQTRDIPYTYKGENTLIRNVEGDFCPACDEGILDQQAGDAYGLQIRQFQQKINATFIEPAFITQVRKKLALDQRQAADIFGGGVNAFSRYETGRTKPPLALIKLLKLLDKHPALLDDIRN
ncbi:MAG: type II toxin-antitoxin system MqsA family antitoxin [Lautropia sp.]|nr:type II toxin-antitoxin system MqsA family antitoxin [Lautropia sp.]